MRILRLVLLSFATAIPASGEAATIACSQDAMEIAPSTVVEPCSTRLAEAGLSDANRASFLFVRGQAYHRTSRMELAAADYDAALKITPDNADILVSRSNIDLRSGDGRAYVARVVRAMDLAPDNPRVLRAAGALLQNSGEPERAIQAYTDALSKGPEPFALYFRAMLYRDKRSYKEALADADALVAMPAEKINRWGYVDNEGVPRDFHAEALSARAETYEVMGKIDLAEKDYDAAIAQERSASTLQARGELLAAKPDRAAEALRDLREAVEREPGNPRLQYNAARILVMLKDGDHAMTALDNAIAAWPNYSRALQLRAKLNRQSAKTDAAVHDYLAAMQSDVMVRRASLEALRRAGYWTTAVENPNAPGLEDAVRACMLDVQCN